MASSGAPVGLRLPSEVPYYDRRVSLTSTHNCLRMLYGGEYAAIRRVGVGDIEDSKIPIPPDLVAKYRDVHSLSSFVVNTLQDRKVTLLNPKEVPERLFITTVAAVVFGLPGDPPTPMYPLIEWVGQNDSVFVFAWSLGNSSFYGEGVVKVPVGGAKFSIKNVRSEGGGEGAHFVRFPQSSLTLEERQRAAAVESLFILCLPAKRVVQAERSRHPVTPMMIPRPTPANPILAEGKVQRIEEFPQPEQSEHSLPHPHPEGSGQSERSRSHPHLGLSRPVSDSSSEHPAPPSFTYGAKLQWTGAQIAVVSILLHRSLDPALPPSLRRDAFSKIGDKGGDLASFQELLLRLRAGRFAYEVDFKTCPISLQPLEDPVAIVDSSGKRIPGVFTRESLNAWLAVASVHPLTGDPIDGLEVVSVEGSSSGSASAAAGGAGAGSVQ